MNKQDLIDSVAEDLGLTKTAAGDAVNAVLRRIAYSLIENTEPVRLTGFGTFVVKVREGRDAKHPRTGEPIHIAQHCVVAFKPHKALKAMVN